MGHDSVTHGTLLQPGAPRRGRTIVHVATFCVVANWPDRRIYEPLADDFGIHAIQWDRSALMDDWARERVRRYRIGLHEFTGASWGLRGLLRYHAWIVRELDRIQAKDGLHFVVAADPDVLPAILWHRSTRRLRYRIIRNEVDYYAGSRAPGRGWPARAKRLGFDLLEAMLHAPCDSIITLNRYAKARLMRWGVPAGKIVVAGLWKPDEYFSVDHEAYKQVLLERNLLTADQVARLRGRIVISFPGLFYRGTHLQELLEAARDYPDAFAVILAGKGHDLPVVEEYSARYGNLLFLGWRSDDDLRELGRITDIMYQPLNPDDNVNWRYFGSTNKTFEAIAAGCMFIGSANNERADLNAEAEFAVQLDFTQDLVTQLHGLFRAVLADRRLLEARQRNARRLFLRYNHAAAVDLIRPLFDLPPRR